MTSVLSAVFGALAMGLSVGAAGVGASAGLVSLGYLPKGSAAHPYIIGAFTLVGLIAGAFGGYALFRKTDDRQD